MEGLGETALLGFGILAFVTRRWLKKGLVIGVAMVIVGFYILADWIYRGTRER